MRWSGPAALLHVVAATPAAAADDLPLALGVTVLLKVVTYDAGFPARGNVVGDGQVSWQHALDFVAGINAGTYNCNDTSNGGSQQTDWRLPNRSELASLLDLGQFNPAVPSGLPFTNFQSSIYWSSTTYINVSDFAWWVFFPSGRVLYDTKDSHFLVLAVRGSS